MLVQDKGVEEYFELFKELKSLINVLNSSLLEFHYIFNFINGLKDDIKPMLKILKPTSSYKLLIKLNRKKNPIMLWPIIINSYQEPIIHMIWEKKNK